MNRPAAAPGTVGHGFRIDLEAATLANVDLCRVLYTSSHSRLVLMSLLPGEEIGAEPYMLDQFFLVEAGNGEAILDGTRGPLCPGSAIVVPAGARHNIVNTGRVSLKLYTIHASPNRRDSVVHRRRADAQSCTQHFDGSLSTLATRAPVGPL